MSAAPRPVLPGRMRVARGPGLLVVRGLGSCVAVTLYDDLARLGGLAHVVLPGPRSSDAADRADAPRYALTAVPALVDALEARGARRDALRAKLVGGARMFPALVGGAGPAVGERNVAAARSVLSSLEIPVLAEDVGGDRGRSVYFDLMDGVVLVTFPESGNVVL